METLNNFASIYCLIAFAIGAVFMLIMLSMAAIGKEKELKNKVHFYLARDKNSELLLYMGKPFRGIDRFHSHLNGCIITREDDFSNFGLNKDDYVNLKWKDDPIEVFISMED